VSKLLNLTEFAPLPPSGRGGLGVCDVVSVLVGFWLPVPDCNKSVRFVPSMGVWWLLVRWSVFQSIDVSSCEPITLCFIGFLRV
jgi:hypothetical protein